MTTGHTRGVSRGGAAPGAGRHSSGRRGGLAGEQLVAALAYARERDYTGWDLYDGESSRLLRTLPVEHKWLNIAVQQAVRRSPVNIRPLLLVEQRRNFMGGALFALANFAAAELTGATRYREEGLRLAEWLLEQDRDGYRGYCGGHNHPVQGLERRTPVEEPGVVGTAQAVRALLAADDHAEHGRFRERARTAAEFVFEELDYEEVPSGARIKYKPGEGGDTYTLNANALGARLLLDLYAAFGDRRFRSGARAILGYVAAHQAPEGGWHYRADPGSSHLSMDNFHNGFIVESFLRYRELCDQQFADTLDRALEFYRGLFDADGGPHWDEQSTYPRDIHASAQGLVVFSHLGETDTSRRVLEWAVTELSDGEGRFYHEKRRLFTKRTTLMRWCQAWMACALAVYLRRLGPLESQHFSHR